MYVEVAFQRINDKEYRIAYYNNSYNRPMLIEDSKIGIVSAISSRNVLYVYSPGSIKEHLEEEIKKLKQNDVRVARKVSIPTAVVEFYKRQNCFFHQGETIIVVNVNDTYTDISIIENEQEDNYRIECGERSLSILDSTILNLEIVRCIKKLQYQRKIISGKILLSGGIFTNSLYVNQIRGLLPEFAIFSYRPREAALIGAAYFLNKYVPKSRDFLENIGNQYIGNKSYYAKLTLKQQQIYAIFLQAIRMREAHADFSGDKEDIYPVYRALKLDYPEIEIIWDYNNSKYIKCNGGGNNHNFKIHFTYIKNCDLLVDSIDQRAEEIIKRSIGDRKHTDEEIVRAIYRVVSEEYHYSKEKNEKDNYPNYAYTLETLLKNGVCRGYALSMVYILNKLQIPIMYIEGNAVGNEFGGHAWNLVQNIEGKYRHLDITWDLGKPENKFNYFDLDDIQMRARRHFWDVRKFPKCS